jgi:putative flippase GtrA
VGQVHAQALKFCAVGFLGLIVNLAAYSGQVGVIGIPPLAAAVGAFSVAVVSNHALNRIWTFQQRGAAYLAQGGRFLAVSLIALLVNLAALDLLLAAGSGTLGAQLLAIVAAAPVAFIGNRSWTFRAGA